MFLRTEQAAGVLLLMAATAAMLWANVFPRGYETFWKSELPVAGGEEDLRHWVNEGLMTIFFFVVALEIKRELVVGELRDRRLAALPVFAAIGGMAGPALIYIALNARGPGRTGWAIPMATDIAFVVGALALLGSRVPPRLRLFLLAIAIVDDIGAIAIIAIAYSRDLDWVWIGTATIALALVVPLRAARVSKPLLYLVPGVMCWAAATRSGIHPTLAGVALGLSVPAHPIRGRALLEELEHRLHPLSSYVAVPLFALANAGVLVTSASLRSAIASPVFWGIVLGLLVGKTIGITSSSLLSDRLPIAGLPPGLGSIQLAGGAALAGIGFTVSLFIVGLAFTDPRLVTVATLGVVAGSTLSAAVGATVLRFEKGISRSLAR